MNINKFDAYQKVVIIGRPNVGKSTLFNRLVGSRRALVHPVPGTTSDRNEMFLSIKDRDFILIDTGGWADDTSIFPAKVKEQMESALLNADVVLFVVDGKDGLHPLDTDLNNALRSNYRKKTILVVNKIDFVKDEIKTLEFYKLGIAEMVPISAEHGKNIFDLSELIYGHLENRVPIIPSCGNVPISILLTGKPNVGKSSLLNCLCRQERSIVHNRPGTTREALDTTITRDDQDYVIIDTPGLHRRRKFRNDMEYLAALSTTHAMERADVAIIVMDIEQGFGESESRIAELAIQNRLACLIAINKWDLVEEKESVVKMVRLQIASKFKFLPWAKLSFISAKTGLRVDKLLSDVDEIYKEYSRIIPEDDLKQSIRSSQDRKPLSREGRILRIKSVKQTGTNPPTFVFTVNDLEILHFSYKRYIENRMREDFGFAGTPIILKFRKEEEAGNRHSRRE